jgi:N-acyl-D-amino-acid deacylase
MRPISRRNFIKRTAVLGVTAAASKYENFIKIRAPFDIIIKNGSIIDGTGAPERLGDVGIRDGKILTVTNLHGKEAELFIDAKDLKVAPGFIDIHSHTDVELLINPKAESMIRQGVTTQVNGQDGESWAPFGGPELQLKLKDFKDEYGFDMPWRDFSGFFATMEKNGTAVNLLTLVGLGTIREFIVGVDDRPTKGDEMQQMQYQVSNAIQQGCWGASTGLEYTPGSFAASDELVELVKVIPAGQRIYSTHMRNEDDKVLEAVDEAIYIARKSAASLQLAHLKASGKRNWTKVDAILEKVDSAASDGIDIHADRYPYIAYFTGLSALFPLWSRDGGTKKFLERLQEDKVLPQIRQGVEEKISRLGSWDAVMISYTHSDPNKVYQGKTLKQISEEESVDPFAFCCKLLIAEENRVLMVGFGMDEEGTERIIAHRLTMISSDAGSEAPYGKSAQGRPHPRAYGTFPRAIAMYVRERKIVTLPTMIKKMTSMPALKLGLRDRGILAPNNWADIVVFDFEKIQDKATFVDPHQYPIGIPYVLVNGIPVIMKGEHTGALAGRILRSR